MAISIAMLVITRGYLKHRKSPSPRRIDTGKVGHRECCLCHQVRATARGVPCDALKDEHIMGYHGISWDIIKTGI